MLNLTSKQIDELSRYVADYLAEERARGQNVAGFYTVRNAIEAFIGGAA